MGQLTDKPCRLCSQQRPLRYSHIFPKFYWDWLKESGSGYFRNTDSPNVKRQDGDKKPLLCNDCEQLLSAWESDTARKVFIPLTNNLTRKVEYGPWFYKFLISVLWRNLAVDLAERSDMLPHGFEPVEYAWRQFLLGRQPLNEYNRLHVFVADLAPGSPFSSVYIARDADFSIVVQGEEPSGVFAKFGRFIIWAEVRAAKPEEWVNTLIIDGTGSLASGDQELRDGYFGSFLIERSNMRKAAKAKLFVGMSPVQKTKLDQWKLDNAPRIANSKLAEAMLADAVSVDAALFIPKVGRNDPCPCGSGTKYKNAMAADSACALEARSVTHPGHPADRKAGRASNSRPHIFCWWRPGELRHRGICLRRNSRC
jgi:hypothetical protein